MAIKCVGKKTKFYPDSFLNLFIKAEVAICFKLFIAENMQVRNSKLAPGLYIVATPIGNARDITLRALDVLTSADVVVCEDTRITGKLFSMHNVSTPLKAYHEHNGEKMRPKILAHLNDGQAVALVSDAGTPLISDPGYQLVAAVREAGYEVFSVPGASSPVAALSIAGMPSDRFLFVGFLPPKTKARQGALSNIGDIAATLIVFENAKRLAALLSDIYNVLGDRDVAVCRELTKKFEEVKRGNASGLAAHYQETGPPKGEIVVLIHGRSDADVLWEKKDVERALIIHLEASGTRQAADEVAALSGWRRREVYQLALESQSENGGGR